MCKRTIYIFASILIFTGIARSQSLFDGVRLGTEPIGTGARAISMGGAAIANANDFSALDWNPAALTLITYTEFSLSGLFKSHSSTASFLGTTADQSLTNFDLGSLGYITPIPTTKGHLAFGISYDRVRDYNSTYSFSAVNKNSSFLDTKGFVQEPGFNSRNQSFQDYLNGLQRNNLAWELYLTDPIKDTLNPKLSTPFHNGLLQTGTVTEEGGVNALRLGGGVDISENVAIGGTLNFFFGTYNYRRVYTETDVNNVTPSTDSIPPNGFKSAQIIDTKNQSQAGFNIKIGLLATPTKFFSFGLTFQSPTVYSINDQFQRTGSSTFKNGSYSSLNELQNPDVSSLNASTVNTYTVTTPLKLGAGVSFDLSGLTISGAADFSDNSQLRFTDAASDLTDLNDAARANLRAVLNWKLGAEYVIKPIGLILRAGYAMNPSPFKGDPSNYNTQNISAGVGILLSKSVITEITYLRTNYHTDHSVYNDLSVTTGNPVSAVVDSDNIVQNLVMLSFSFRF